MKLPAQKRCASIKSVRVCTALHSNATSITTRCGQGPCHMHAHTRTHTLALTNALEMASAQYLRRRCYARRRSSSPLSFQLNNIIVIAIMIMAFINANYAAAGSSAPRPSHSHTDTVFVFPRGLAGRRAGNRVSGLPEMQTHS